MRRLGWLIPGLAYLCGLAAPAGAQPLGTFRWQLHPYCNIVAVSVTQVAGIYRLEGTDDQCGGGAPRASVVGTAFLNPDGTVGLGLNIVVAPNGGGVHVSAALSLVTLNGTWTDSGGEPGDFVFTPGAGTGGPPRPLPGAGGAVTSVGGGAGISVDNANGAVTVSLMRTASGAYQLTNDRGLLAAGPFGTNGILPAAGPGSRLMWLPSRAAFRAGLVDGAEWDSGNVGSESAALNKNTRATGTFSLAVNDSTLASGTASFAAGFQTTASGANSVALGSQTQAIGPRSVAMGIATSAIGSHAVSMGNGTIASGGNSLSAGALSQANGAESLAMGLRVIAGGNGSVVLGTDGIAQAAASGTFIFADRSTTTPVVGFAPNEFIVRAAGGVGFYTNAGLTTGVEMAAGGSSWAPLSDANMKENFRDVPGEEVLAKLARIPIREWNCKTQDPGIRHMGPTAQDFRAAFGLGDFPLRINTIDADGVALAAVKALEARTRELRVENDALKVALDEVRRELRELKEGRRD